MLNNFKKCKSCGKIFSNMGRPICPECIKKQDEEFTKVRKYIYDNPTVKVEDVAEETEVPLKTILQFLKEGRLQLKSADGLLACEKCGIAITTGTMCENCKKNLASALQSSVAPGGAAVAPPKQKDTSGLKTQNKLHINLNKR